MTQTKKKVKIVRKKTSSSKIEAKNKLVEKIGYLFVSLLFACFFRVIEFAMLKYFTIVNRNTEKSQKICFAQKL